MEATSIGTGGPGRDKPRLTAPSRRLTEKFIEGGLAACAIPVDSPLWEAHRRRHRAAFEERSRNAAAAIVRSHER